MNYDELRQKDRQNNKKTERQKVMFHVRNLLAPLGDLGDEPG